MYIVIPKIIQNSNGTAHCFGNKKAQLWLRNPRDTTAFQIHPDEIQETMMIIISVLRRVETNIQWVYYGYIQLEIRYLVTVSFVFEL